MSDRIYYSRPPIYETFVNDYGIFKSYVDMFVFCGALGYQRNRKQPLDGGEKEMLWANIQRTDLYKSIAAAIAYQETGNPEVLTDTYSQLEILGEYAIGGVEILEETIDTKGDPTTEFAEFILEEGAPVLQDADTGSSLGDVV